MRAFLWTSALLALAVASPAWAEESAETLVSRGVQLRRDHRDADALDAFRRAYQLVAAPRTRTQIALAEQALGHWVEAERDLLSALDAADDPWIRGHAQLLQGALSSIKEHLGTIEVESNAPGVELYLNGDAVGTLPMAPLRVAAGEIDIELHRPQHESIRRRLTLMPKASLQTVIEFVEHKDSREGGTTRSEPAPPDSATPAGHAPELAAAPLPSQPGLKRELENRSEAQDSSRSVAWVLLGGAAAFLGTGIVAQLVREQNTAHYNDDALCLQPGLSRDQRCGAYRGRADLATTVAITGYLGAAILGGASALTFLTASASAKPQATSVRAVILAGPNGVLGDCVVRF